MVKNSGLEADVLPVLKTTVAGILARELFFQVLDAVITLPSEIRSGGVKSGYKENSCHP